MPLTDKDILKLVESFMDAIKKENLKMAEFIASKFAKTIIDAIRHDINPYEQILGLAIEKAKEDYNFYFFLSMLVDAGHVVSKRDITISEDEYAEFAAGFNKRYGTLYYFKEPQAPIIVSSNLPNLGDSLQSPLGKEPIANKKIPYLPHQLVHMKWLYHSVDKEKGTRYFHSGKRKDTDQTEDESKTSEITLKSDYKVRMVHADMALQRTIDKDHIPEGDYIYVLTYKGSLYAVKNNEADFDELGQHIPLHHSSIRAGQQVGCAGHITVNDAGKITLINANSGHMKPPMENLITAVIWLYEEKKYLDPDCVIELQKNYLKDANGESIDRISIYDLINKKDIEFNNPELADFRERNKDKDSNQTKPF